MKQSAENGGVAVVGARRPEQARLACGFWWPGAGRVSSGARRQREFIYPCFCFSAARERRKNRVLKGGFTNMKARVQGGFSWVNPRVGYSF
ncbi:hypothetical protein QL285_011079 [Trifolium repens]|nr:hypothetical protein QL285_011079 [Trifolium repens]